MSNSTQNKCPFCKSELISLVLPSNPPQYKTYCPNCEKYKVSNSTQNDEIGKMEKAINEGFAESERDLKDKRTPLDRLPTQNDHETHTACIERIKKEGASATCCHCNPHDGCTLEMKPTQNDWYDHAVKNPGFKSGLNALKNDTQNDWDEELYKVACHIHAESMAYKFGMAGFDEPEVIIYRRLKQLIADARREGHPTINGFCCACDYDIEFMKHDREFEIESLKKTCKHCGVIRGVKLHEDTDSHDRYQVGYNKAIDDVLATLRDTLREEETS